jgi:hypothetical protein
MGWAMSTPFSKLRKMEFSNYTENAVYKTIRKYVDIDRFYMPTSYEQYLKQLSRGTELNKFFKNVPSPYLTPNGNNKRTEMSLQLESGLSMRVECKHQTSYSNLVATATFELNFVEDIPEDMYVLILEGKAFTMPYTLNILSKEILNKNLKKKVWYGTLAQFEELLKVA